MKKEVENVPELRFCEFNKDWSPKHILDLFDIKHGFAFKGEFFSSDGKYIVLTPGNFNHGGGFRYQGEKEKYYSSSDFPIDYILQKGDLLTVMTEQAIGLIGSPILVPEADKFLHNQRLGLFQSKADTNNGFMFHYMKTEQLRTKMSKSASGMKVRHTSPKLIGGISLFVPTLPEQQKIAFFLTAVDKKIELLTRKNELLEQYKKGVMQKIFSQEIRFKNDNGQDYPDWEEKRLGDCFSERSERGYIELPLLSIGTNGVYPQEESEKRDTSNTDKSKYKRICPGDIGYNTMRMWQGRSALSSLEGIVSPAYTILVGKNNILPLYFGYLFRMNRMIYNFFQKSQGLVSDTWQCRYKDFATISVEVPLLPEQQKIANFLSSIDAKIKTVQAQLTQTQNFKKGLLQKMFV